MRRTFSIFLTAIFIGFFNHVSYSQTSDTKEKAFVLLELFTSEGCPTCPPADANLAFFEREQPFANTEIVTLALHVDYWNSTKWRDVYSSPIFSRRQQLYSQALKINQNYTPQMIVDGQAEFTGNSLSKAQKAILDAGKTPKATIELSNENDKVKIKISNAPAHENATVFLAVTESNLVSNRKGVKGEKFPEHVSVVRNLASLGMLTAQQANFELETALQIQPEWKRENLKLVIFVQENASRKIFGATRTNLK